MLIAVRYACCACSQPPDSLLDFVKRHSPQALALVIVQQAPTQLRKFGIFEMKG